MANPHHLRNHKLSITMTSPSLQHNQRRFVATNYRNRSIPGRYQARALCVPLINMEHFDQRSSDGTYM